MNGALVIHQNISFGPRLVIVGALLGSIFVSAFTFSINKNYPLLEGSEKPTSLRSDGGDQALANTQSATMDPTAHAQGQCLVSDHFPASILQWCPEITANSLEYDLPPGLIAAVMLQESGGDPDAYSHSGAVGLMQIMPRDGIASSFMCINGPCFTNRPSISELKDPGFNIEYGTRMLASLQARYGNIRDALKSYGPMDVGYSYADKVLAIYTNYE